MINEEDKVHTGYADGPALADTKSRTPAVDKSLTRITEKEVCEFFNEGLKQAASAARQLGIVQEHDIWTDISTLCDHIRSQGLTLFTQRGLSWTETLKIIDDRQNMTSSVLEMKRSPKKKFLMS